MRHRTYREETLRVNQGSSFRSMFLMLLAVGGSFVGIAHVLWDRPVYWFYDLAVAPLLYAVMLWAALAYLRRRLTITVMPEGLRTFDVWGRDHTVPWDSLRSARRWSFFGMPSARLKSDAASVPLWVPLNLDRSDLFAELVAEYTEPANPLHRLICRPPR